jgi:hypothetical protein
MKSDYWKSEEGSLHGWQAKAEWVKIWKNCLKPPLTKYMMQLGEEIQYWDIPAILTTLVWFSKQEITPFTLTA